MSDSTVPVHSSSSDDKKLIDDVLTYWYGGTTFEKLDNFKSVAKKWYAGGEAVDSEIRGTFGKHVQLALEGKYDRFINNSTLGVRGELVLIVLLDQFPRNIFRKTAKAFSGDSKSKEVVLSVLNSHRWSTAKRELPPLMLISFLLPLMHQESMEDQNLCYDKVDELITKFRQEFVNNENYANRKNDVQECLQLLLKVREFSAKHRDIISKYGRYPYRNAVLGRASSEHELEFLKDGDSFGQ